MIYVPVIAAPLWTFTQSILFEPAYSGFGADIPDFVFFSLKFYFDVIIW